MAIVKTENSLPQSLVLEHATEPVPSPLQVENVAIQVHGSNNLGLAVLGGIFEELSVSYQARVKATATTAQN